MYFLHPPRFEVNKRAINKLASDKLEARRSEREILRKLRDGPVHRERSQIVVVRQPLIFRIAIQECDLALGVVPNKVPLELCFF